MKKNIVYISIIVITIVVILISINLIKDKETLSIKDEYSKKITQTWTIINSDNNLIEIKKIWTWTNILKENVQRK